MAKTVNAKPYNLDDASQPDVCRYIGAAQTDVIKDNLELRRVKAVKQGTKWLDSKFTTRLTRSEIDATSGEERGVQVVVMLVKHPLASATLVDTAMTDALTYANTAGAKSDMKSQVING